MAPPDPSAAELPGRMQFRGTTKSREDILEPDTSVIVTDEVVAVQPAEDVSSGGPNSFTVPLDEIRRVRCDGFVCRTMTLETASGEYTVPTGALDEVGFRKAIVENTGLTNQCLRLNLDRFGICPCGAGTYAGCMMTIVGVGIMLSIVGALLGAGVLVAGIGLLVLSYGARKLGKWRGANVWEQEANGTNMHA